MTPSPHGEDPHPRVLVVDDEPIIRRVLVRVLDEAGFRTASADYGVTAVGVVQSTPHPFDLLVTDIRMPYMDGLDLARVMRNLSPSTPVLFISGYAASNALEDGMAGAPFLQKPFTTETFLETIQFILADRDLNNRCSSNAVAFEGMR